MSKRLADYFKDTNEIWFREIDPKHNPAARLAKEWFEKCVAKTSKTGKRLKSPMPIKVIK